MDLWANAIAVQMGVPLLEVDWSQLACFDRTKRLELLSFAQREARLSAALLYLRHAEAISTEDLAEFNRLLMGPLCIASQVSRKWRDMGFDARILTVPDTPFEVQAGLWKRTLTIIGQRGGLPSIDLVSASQELAERYPLSSRELIEVEKGLSDQSLLMIEGNSQEFDGISRVCKRMLGRAMEGVAQRVETPFGLSDLVLPAGAHHLLREILIQQRYGAKVIRHWGLGSLFHQVQGCRALFAGPSGTGKTMAASAIANELGLELHRIDLSQVVSKYIGETEKNLDRVFNAASRARVVLFIDEADALLGKRSEVKDAHDRYANIETSFLLQKMEAYDGVVILATNLIQNIDDAFFRRIDTIIEFPLPQESDRLQLWQRLRESNAPLDRDVDLSLLARNFELTGGHIKNCILNAAFYAAENQSPISMTHLVKAVGREYLKIGKPISKATFGEFYAGVRKTLAVN